MDKELITLNRCELDNIITAILMTYVDTNAQKYPYFSEALDGLYKKLANIREKWDEERIKGAK